MAIIKALINLNFGQILLPTTGLAVIECLKVYVKCCDSHSSAFIFDWLVFILAGNEDNHNILDKFEFGKNRPGTAELAALEKSPQTYNGRNAVMTQAPSFLIEFLHCS